jgi:hypothetical protein
MTRGKDALPLPFPAPRLASRIADMEHPDLLVDLRLEILDRNFITVPRRRIFETVELYHHKAPTLRLAVDGTSPGQMSALTPRPAVLLHRSEPPDSAITGLMRCSRRRGYSITSSARTRMVGGTASPRDFAVLALNASSNFVGCSTGRSAGLAPLRILTTIVALCRNSAARLGP